MQTAAGEYNDEEITSVACPSTNMQERDVVFGGEKKLRSTIDGALEIYDADGFFILTGCTAGIIGEDIVNVANEYQEKGYPVYAVETPGFAGDGLMGYEVAFRVLLDNIVQEGLEKEKGLVNLFGIIPHRDPFWRGNFEELTRILKKLGLRVNTFFTEHQTLENVRRSSAAELNIIVNPYLLKSAAEIYEERFGVPSLRFPGLPIGASDTGVFVRAVAERLGLDQKLVDQVISEEEDYVYSYHAVKGNGLGWNRFAVVADPNLAVGATRFLTNDYSQTPRVVVITEAMYRPEDKQRIIDQIQDLEYATPPDIYFETDYFKIIEILEKYPEVSMLIGSSTEREYCVNNGIQCCALAFPLYDRMIVNKSIVGYKGSLSLVEELYNFL
jgi:nitrogenase molybdenum-iron protein beta chain